MSVERMEHNFAIPKSSMGFRSLLRIGGSLKCAHPLEWELFNV